jgi:ATP-dependent Lhr-like helicase
VDDKSDLFDRLHLKLIQTIAVTELLLEGWVEPAQPSSFDLSTLTQQIISLIAESGGCTAQDAYRILCERGAFREVDRATFAKLLRQLGSIDVIEQTSQGDLILGLIGEDLRKDKGFYAAFKTADAFTVLHDGQRIGSVDDAPPLNEQIILAGRRWKVVDVDQRQLVVYVVPASGAKGAPFLGGGGLLHPRIVEMMRTILCSEKSFPYLSATAADLLQSARKEAAVAGICTKSLIALDLQTTAIMTWTGTRIQDSLRAILNAEGAACGDETIALVVNESLEKCETLLRTLSKTTAKDDAVLECLAGPPGAKYDPLLGDALVLETKRRRWLDLPAASNTLRQLTAKPEATPAR